MGKQRFDQAAGDASVKAVVLQGAGKAFVAGADIKYFVDKIKADRIQDIVDFSEIGDSLDEPVKHYSSGMYVRLAFSVAAHLEPEILLVADAMTGQDAVNVAASFNELLDIDGDATYVRTSDKTILLNWMAPDAPGGGTAVMMELARVLAARPSRRTLRSSRARHRRPPACPGPAI